ncbi:MAG: hypothetical protein Q9175_007692, partial [Cornicularia normoerica]
HAKSHKSEDDEEEKERAGPSRRKETVGPTTSATFHKPVDLFLLFYDASSLQRLLTTLGTRKRYHYMGYEKDAGPLSLQQEAYLVASNDDSEDLVGQHLLPAPSNDPKSE